MRYSILAALLLCSSGAYAQTEDVTPKADQWQIVATVKVKNDTVHFAYQHKSFDSIKACMGFLKDATGEFARDTLALKAKVAELDKDGTVESTCEKVDE